MPPPLICIGGNHDTFYYYATPLLYTQITRAGRLRASDLLGDSRAGVGKMIIYGQRKESVIIGKSKGIINNTFIIIVVIIVIIDYY